MMPTIGDKLRFAVEYNLDEVPGGEWLFGKFCYWCGGTRLGDYELGTSLRDVLFQLERIVCDAGRRTNLRFSALSAEQVFNLLASALFSWEVSIPEVSVPTGVADEEQWARQNIIPAVDIFNEWMGFLVEGDNSGRFIVAHVPHGRVQEWLLKPGEVDEVLKEVVRDLLALLESVHLSK